VSGNEKAHLTHGGHTVHLNAEPTHSSQHHLVPGRGTQRHLLACNIKQTEAYAVPRKRDGLNSRKYHEDGGTLHTIGAL
jgi:hypothetical protein